MTIALEMMKAAMFSRQMHQVRSEAHRALGLPEAQQSSALFARVQTQFMCWYSSPSSISVFWQTQMCLALAHLSAGNFAAAARTIVVVNPEDGMPFPEVRYFDRFTIDASSHQLYSGGERPWPLCVWGAVRTGGVLTFRDQVTCKFAASH